MKNFLSVFSCAAIIILCMLLLVSPARGESFDSFERDLYDQFDKRCNEVRQLVADGNSEKAVEESREALADLGEISHLPPNATQEQRREFELRCEYVFFFADVAFWRLYEADDYESAIAYAEHGLKAAEVQLKNNPTSDYLETSWVLQNVGGLGYCYSENGKSEKAIATYERGFNYVKTRESEKLEPAVAWDLGRIHTAMGYELWQLSIFSPRRYTSDSFYLSAAEHLLNGLSSQLDDPEEINDILPDVLDAALYRVADDHDLYKKRLADYTTRLQGHNSPALDLTLTDMYSNRAYWEFDYGSVRDAIPYNVKTIQKVGFDFDETTYSLYSIFEQAGYHVTVGDAAAAETQLARLRDYLPRLSDPVDVVTVEGWITATAADLHFVAMDAASMTQAYDALLNNSKLKPSNSDHAWLLALALFNNIAFEDDPKAAARMLERFDAVIKEAEKNDDGETDILLLRQYYELAKLDACELFWFDEEYTNSSLPPAPADLAEVKLSELYVMLEFEYRKGDRKACERVGNEMLRRGVSMEYLTAIFWIYNGGK